MSQRIKKLFIIIWTKKVLIIKNIFLIIWLKKIQWIKKILILQLLTIKYLRKILQWSDEYNIYISIDIIPLIVISFLLTIFIIWVTKKIIKKINYYLKRIINKIKR
jgi:hypothetical protein